MSASSDPRRDDLLEAYLDGLLDDAQRAAFAERLRTDPELAGQVELQLRIDGALDRLFQVETPSHAQVSAALAAAVAPQPAATLPLSKPLPATESATPPAVTKPAAGRWYWAAAGLAAAAAIAWVITTLTGGASGIRVPMFTPRPLVEVYAQTLEAGFEPTYNCDEPEQFATTFKQRQGQPLRLLAMASGAEMLGLAYTGGMSRQTTAMLCRVDGQPVMAFVDRAEADLALAAQRGESPLNVFRQERDGLVFYEVTPLAEPRVIQLFAPSTPDGQPLTAAQADAA